MGIARLAILGQFNLSHMGCLIEIVKISKQKFESQLTVIDPYICSLE